MGRLQVHQESRAVRNAGPRLRVAGGYDRVDPGEETELDRIQFSSEVRAIDYLRLELYADALLGDFCEAGFGGRAVQDGERSLTGAREQAECEKRDAIYREYQCDTD